MLKSEDCLRAHVGLVHRNDKKRPIESLRKNRYQKCDSCDRKYYNLRIHMKRMHSEKDSNIVKKEIKCELCDKTFLNQIYLKAHQKGVHYEERDHQCSQCDKAFSSKSFLKVHIKTIHERIKEFACEMCSKSFPMKRPLEYHMKSIHDKGRTKKECKLCNKNFYSLERHMKYVHDTRKNKVKCDTCDKMLKSEACLKAHVRVIHRDNKNIKV